MLNHNRSSDQGILTCAARSPVLTAATHGWSRPRSFLRRTAACIRSRSLARLRGGGWAGQGKAHRPAERRRRISLRGSAPSTGQNPRHTSWLQMHGPLRHRQRRHDRPEPKRQYPWARVASLGRSDDHRHEIPEPPRRPDEGSGRLRRIRPPDHRHAHRHARLQPERQDLREVLVEQQGMGRRFRAAGAGRHVGQPPRPTTARRAPAG